MELGRAEATPSVFEVFESTEEGGPGRHSLVPQLETAVLQLDQLHRGLCLEAWSWNYRDCWSWSKA